MSMFSQHLALATIGAAVSASMSMSAFGQADAPGGSPAAAGKTIADVTHGEVDAYRSACGGFFVPEVWVGDLVRPGHLLGRVLAPIGGEQILEVRAERTGVVMTCRAYPMVHAQELLVRIAVTG